MSKIQITVPEYLIPSFDGIKGVSVTDKTVTFDGYSMDYVEKIVGRIYNKTLSNGNTFSNIPTEFAGENKYSFIGKSLNEAAIEKVKQYLPDTFDPKTMKVWRSASAFTMIDRDNDILSKDYLEAMAEEANIHNPALCWMHNGYELKGSVFFSEVIAMDDPKYFGNFVLMQYFITNPKATLPGQPESNTIDYNLESGFIKYVSVGFGRYQSEFKQTGDEYVRIISRPSTGKVIHPELSLVYFGAQPGAGIKSIDPTREDFNFKSFSPKILTTQKKRLMTDKIFEVGEKKFVIKAADEAGTITLTGDVANLETELKALSSELPELRKAVTELKAAKEPLVNNILNIMGEKGLKKSVALIPTEAELYTKSFAYLSAQSDELQKEFIAKNPQNQLKDSSGNVIDEKLTEKSGLKSYQI